jgi:hypothetical protein
LPASNKTDSGTFSKVSVSQSFSKEGCAKETVEIKMAKEKKVTNRIKIFLLKI